MPDRLNKLSRFWQELKRRNVLRTIAVYAGTAFVILEATTIIFPRWGLPDWTIDVVLYLLILGAAITITVSWIFDITPDGVKKTGSQEEIPDGEKTAASNSWRIATYVSLTVIVVLIVFNVFTRNRISKDLFNLEKSIAVLPFENLFPDSSQLWFTDGISDVISNQLAKITGLRVIGRTSTLKYKKEKKTIPEIGEELGVNYIIEGTVQKQEDKIRIIVQLVRVKNEAQLWSELYDNEWEEIFDIQTDIAKRIASNLQTVLTPEETKQIEHIGTDNPEAWELYLKGNHLMTQWNADAFHRAIDIYKRAIALDPDFAEAYAGIAMATFEFTIWDVAEPDFELIPVALEWADKALELNPNLGEPYFIMGSIKDLHYWDWQGADKAFSKGMELNPNYVWGRISYANFLTLTRRFDESIKLGEVTIKLDPLDPGVYIELGYVMWLDGHDKEALELYQKSLELKPDFSNAYDLLTQYYANNGIYNQHVADYCKKLMDRYDNNLQLLDSGELSTLGIIYEMVGRQDEAQEILSEFERRMAAGIEITFCAAGYLYNVRGFNEKAIDMFEMSFEKREQFMFWINVHCQNSSIYSNPRMIDLLQKIGFDRS